MTVQAASSALAPAAIATRVIAFIIDLILISIVGFVIGQLIGDASAVGSVTRAIIYGVLGFLYFGYTWTTSRATPGQRGLGLMTVNEDGSALTWNQAALRWAYLFGPSVVQNLFFVQIGGTLGTLVGLIVLGYYIYLLYTSATDPKRQGFHDKQTRTMVAVKTAA
ncbi:MAG: RDD family protein [Candidatus Limnocylindria bacterium]